MPRFAIFLSAVAALLLLALPVRSVSAESVSADSASADTLAADDSDCEPECVRTGEWEIGIALGYGYAPNPLADADDILLPVLPRISYYGERFFIETSTIGYTLAESAQQRLNLIARPNLDYFYFADSGTFYSVLTHPFRYGLPGELSKRELTWLGGLEYSWFRGPWQLQISAGADISVGHDGYEATLGGKYHWQHDDNSLQLSLGLLYRDDRLTDYYYGVTEEETSWLEKRYAPGSSLSPYFSLTDEHQLSEHLSLLMMLAVQRPDSVISDSPLVTERWFTASFFGLSYVF
ncbi:MipA/OmpV family protein [Permianibacter sp. IMCC34836]|uniref:MipA/OmpV family protein n=1 Tax=Permianibacter fluminis TaxID=2738515 RepID=UPI0015568B0A|nr:MipA/OmpV family protein [Permianibacter fluminis]NQD35696.1 MipA/OmpV family protein [Permianibacter fluminis]